MHYVILNPHSGFTLQTKSLQYFLAMKMVALVSLETCQLFNTAEEAVNRQI